MKSKTMRLCAVLLALTLITSCFVGGTFAKYTSEATGSDQARVAKWAFKVGDAEIESTNVLTFDLFNTIRTTGNTTAEGNVATDLIAPGTAGDFSLVLTNGSEVNAKYAIDYTITNTSNVPLQFSVDGGTTWTDTLNDVVADDVATKLGMTDSDKTTTIKVLWKWVYDGADVLSGQTDESDTTLGIAGTAQPKIEAKVTAIQID